MGRGRGRPSLKRRITFDPKVKYFKPQGVPMSILETIELKEDEFEAVRLKNIKNFNQKECAKKMHISSATLQRVLSLAYKKIAIALVEGKAIKIINK